MNKNYKEVWLMYVQKHLHRQLLWIKTHALKRKNIGGMWWTLRFLT